MALLKLLLMAGLVLVITSWLRRALTPGQGRSGSASKKPWWDDKSRRNDTRPKLQTLQFRRDPYEVLGITKGAGREAIDEAFESLIRENSPDAVSWFRIGGPGAASADIGPGPRALGPLREWRHLLWSQRAGLDGWRGISLPRPE